MPWNMDSYPDSFKNFNDVTKKKAIDIANALIDEGYNENQAIPIAIKQAKQWYNESSQQERKEFKKHGDSTKRDSD